MIKKTLMTAALAAAVLTGCGGKETQGKPAPADAAPNTAATAAPETANVKIDMAFVEGGTFRMGCTPEQGECSREEKPVHSVTLSDFHISKYEVTQGLWKTVMGDNPSEFTGDDNLPVENVSWEDACEFILKLNSMTGKRYRLPTEAEWEYAARGGNKSRGYVYSGSNDIDDVAWYMGEKTRPAGDTAETESDESEESEEYSDNDESDEDEEYSDSDDSEYDDDDREYSDSDDIDDNDINNVAAAHKKVETHPVGGKQPNELGIYDMSGNVWEWVHDWSGNYRAGAQTDPAGASSGISKIKFDGHRVARGGSWDWKAGFSRVSYRRYLNPEKGDKDVGFRLVLGRDLPEVDTVPTVPPDVSSNPDSIAMVLVQGVTFYKSGDDITLNDFYMGKYEVTQGLWKAVMGYNPSNYLRDDNLPVERVSWDAAQNFIRKLNDMTGKKYRLPSSDEWSYAARGGNRSRGYEFSGSNNVNDVAWYAKNSNMQPHHVGTKLPNELGIHDMSGNVWEWTGDEDYDKYRTYRGGGWQSDSYKCDSGSSGSYYQDHGSKDQGFRLALSADSNVVSLDPCDRRGKAVGGYKPRPVSPRDASSSPKSIAMVSVRGGAFTGEEIGNARVNNFYISKYEVTQGLWTAVMGNNPSKFTGDNNLPVETVSLDDVYEFIRKLNRMTGKKYRLPTEAEWEYAARGGRAGRGYRYSGSNCIGNVAWYKENSGGKTHLAGTRQPNELGIHDMSGNVWEWTSTAENSFRVTRGGSWDYDVRHSRVSFRGSRSPGDRHERLGFRLARSGPKTPAVPAAKTAAKKAVKINIDMVSVEGGTFTMGCTPKQSDECKKSEKPAHKVTVGDFRLGKYEVTQGVWNAVMDTNPSRFKGNDNLPVERVTWHDVQEFIKRLNAKTGKKYRLPTEAEWEYAARGGNRSRGYKYSGSDDVDDVAWYGANTKRPRPAGAKQPNELGIYDMSGNVWEWVDDWYDENYYGSSPADNPKGPKPARTRVQRGGTWSASDFHCRVSDRFSYWPDKRDSDTGFRLAQDP